MSITDDLAQQHREALSSCREHLRYAEDELKEIEKIEAMLSSQGIHLKRVEVGLKAKWKELCDRLKR